MATDYFFPADLIPFIQSGWPQKADALFPLPSDAVLERLLETCYHASLRTSEHRSVQCVLAYAAIENISEERLRLTDRPIVLTDSELVRLSPVTQRRQTVIGCHDWDDWIGIWGFFDYGHAWVQHSAGDPPATPVLAADLPPDCLTITIEGPGALTVSRGRAALIRLRDGNVVRPLNNLFQSTQNPLGRFFSHLMDDLKLYAPRDAEVELAEEQSPQRSLLQVYTVSLLSILERIRLSQHGGCLVIAQEPLGQSLAQITYPVTDHVGLARDIVAYKALEDRLHATRQDPEPNWELERCRTELDLHSMSRQLIRGISQISLFAGVDGAVLLDAHLRVQGFGVRFPVVLPPHTTVIDALTSIAYSFDQWGLRHQSLFSVCHNSEASIGLIVSQDGASKAVKSIAGQLYFWDGLLD